MHNNMALADLEVLDYSYAHVPGLPSHSIAGLNHIALVVDYRQPS